MRDLYRDGAVHQERAPAMHQRLRGALFREKREDGFFICAAASALADQAEDYVPDW
jgi:hypothetical protein